MDDQFGGRTDDDLFYDELEPVADEAPPAPDAPAAAPPSVAAPPSAAASAGESTSSCESAAAHAPSAAPPSEVPRSLASSRWADKPAADKPVTSSSSSTAPNAASSSSSQKDASSGPPHAPRPHHHKPPPRNTAASADARLQSGANPRQRLTNDELAAKMAQMKLLAAEKTRKFERAEMDQRQHAEAYARGMEEARRRRADEDRRRLDDERARNRERKLRAMSAKEGGWDEGKDPADEDGAPRRAFRGANGDVRGVRGGLAGSRYSRDGDVPDVDRFLDDRHRAPRARGRGGGRARGGAYQDGGLPPPSKRPGDAAPALTTDEFPALPGASAKPAPAVVPPLPSPLPAGGKWDDEMEALDAVNKSQS